MSEMPPPAYKKAEQLVDAAGLRVGRWAGRVVRRMQHTARALNQEPGAEQREGPGEPRPTMQRAEALVDQLGHYTTRWAHSGNIQFRRALAHLREGMEDMWVEAQEVQRRPSEKPRTEVHEETQEQNR